MDNLNNRTYRDTTAEKDLRDAVQAVTMPVGMAGELLEGCKNAAHSRKFLFRHSKLIAVALLLTFTMAIGTTSYAAYHLYRTKNLAVFFDYGISSERIDAIGEELLTIPGISSVRFISGDEAWETFRAECLPEDMWDSFSENPLQNSSNYRVAVRLDADTAQIRELIEQLDGVRRIKDLKELEESELQD